jgi:hypothetical protein
VALARVTLGAVAVLVWLAAPAQAQEVKTTSYTIDGRSFSCNTTLLGSGWSSYCAEVGGPYQSACIGILADAAAGTAAREACSDNYGATWDPSAGLAPPLPATTRAPSLPAAVPPPAVCGFTLGFADLRAMIPAEIGWCLTDAAPQPNGDVQQPTQNGLLVWRKADNWTAFTDGATTWVNGPQGLQHRANSERFPWEPPAS